MFDALYYIKTAPPGAAVTANVDITGEGTEAAFLLREESEKIKSHIGPEIEIRTAIFERKNVALVPLMVRVGAETPENIWETWINFNDGSGASRQQKIIFCR